MERDAKPLPVNGLKIRDGNCEDFQNRKGAEAGHGGTHL